MSKPQSFHTRSVAHVGLFTLFCAALSFSGCKKETEERRETQRLEVSVPDQLSSAKAELITTVQSYESVRAALAADQSDVTAAANTLAEAATTAAIKLPSNLREPLTNLAEAADKLRQMPKQDADAVRKEFGEVSRAYVNLLVAEPALKKGLFVFECPMAQGYKQWVQPSEKLENPYMGSRMLECGVPGKWE